MNCEDCGKITNTWFGGNALCYACYNKRYQNEVLEKSKTLKETSDFKDWRMCDMSELFWIHLGKYVKNPNKHSLKMMFMARNWACHADSGLANAICNALKWCNLDLYKEKQRKDLPEE